MENSARNPIKYWTNSLFLFFCSNAANEKFSLLISTLTKYDEGKIVRSFISVLLEKSSDLKLKVLPSILRAYSFELEGLSS